MPSTYTVTFTLPGFGPVRREGIVLQGNFAATVTADLEVGALEEPITVSGASPVVDLQNTQGFWFFTAFRLSQTDSYVADSPIPGPGGRRLKADSGFFVQDRWVIEGLSLFGGFRYDWFNAGWLDQARGGQSVRPRALRAGGRLSAVLAGLVDPRRRLVRFVWQPTHGAEGFDGKFLAANALGTTSDLNPLGSQPASRVWTDRDLNGTVIDAAGNIRLNEIGPPRNVDFGTPIGSLKVPPDLQRGNNWEEAVSVQHEVLRNMSVTAGYYRRQFYNIAASRKLRGRSAARSHRVHRSRAISSQPAGDGSEPITL